jgi:hypothetical protein
MISHSLRSARNDMQAKVNALPRQMDEVESFEEVNQQE